jgi:predicted transcriptional regulator
MSPEQCRAARGWLAWSQDDLARAARVPLSSVYDFENGHPVPGTSYLNAMRSAFENVGMSFPFVIEGGRKRTTGISYTDPERDMTH